MASFFMPATWNNGMLEQWNNGQKRITLCWIKGFGINFQCFSMNAFIGSRDNHSLMAIMALPNEWLTFFDVKKSLKA